MKQPGPCACKLSEKMFKLKASSAKTASLAREIEPLAKDALDEMMAANPELRFVSAWQAFEGLAEVIGVEASYMKAHSGMSDILDACDTAPPGSTERR
jgi:hypothetical protein